MPYEQTEHLLPFATDPNLLQLRQQSEKLNNNKHCADWVHPLLVVANVHRSKIKRGKFNKQSHCQRQPPILLHALIKSLVKGKIAGLYNSHIMNSACVRSRPRQHANRDLVSAPRWSKMKIEIHQTTVNVPYQHGRVDYRAHRFHHMVESSLNHWTVPFPSGFNIPASLFRLPAHHQQQRHTHGRVNSSWSDCSVPRSHAKCAFHILYIPILLRQY